jgi:ribosomal protein L22
MTEKTEKTKIKEKKPAEKPKAQEKAEQPKTEKVEKKKEEKAEKPKKTQAVAKTLDAHMSMKVGKYICRFIKNKSIDRAIADLIEVAKLKKAVPYRGEIPHRKGMMSGRYPVNASKLIINTLKALKGNAIVNGMDIEKTRITEAISNFAMRPSRSGGRKAKRAHILIKAKEVIK